jgi:hypothetical protein
MAVTRTERFALHRWDDGSDSFNREQNDTDNRQVEALAAVFRSGLDAGKGDPTEDSFIRSFYYATDTELLYFCNGTVWVTLNSYSTSTNIADLPVGTVNSPGAVTTAGTVKTIKYALADHAHGVPDSAAPIAIGTSNLEGTESTIALSDHVHEIGNLAIDGSGMFAASVVNAAAIGAGAVVEAKIGSGAVTETKIGTSAVTETKIGTGAVTPLKIGSALAGDGLGRNISTGVLAVNVDDSTIEINSDTLRIKDLGVTTAKLGDLQVTGAKIAAATITSGKFAAGAVSEASLASGAVTETKIGTGAVTTDKIADGDVTAVKLDSGIAGSGIGFATGVLSVNVDGTNLEIDSDTLRIKDSGVLEAKIDDGAVTETKIGTGAVTTDKIADGDVTAVKLDSGIAGSGLASATGVLSVNVDDSTIEINSDTLRIKNSGVTAAKLNSGIAGTGIGFATGVLSVKVDGTTIEHNGSGNLRIVNGSVDTTQIANDAVDYTKIDTGIYYNATTLGAGGAIKYSLASPTGGSAGDIWLQYV